MKKIVLMLMCSILGLGKYAISQEVKDSVYKLIHGHDYIAADKKPYVDKLLRVKWSIPIDRHLRPPVIMDGIIFLYGNHDFAIDGETGKKLYFDSKIAQSNLREAMEDSIIYNEDRYGAECTNIYNGKKYELKSSITEKIIYPVKDSLVFVFKDRKKDSLVAYNIISKKNKWSYPYKPRFQYTEILNDKILLGDGRNVYCLEAKTGEMLWQIDNIRFESNIIVRGINAFCFTSNGFYEINLETGEVLWEYLELKGGGGIADDKLIYFYYQGLNSLNTKTYKFEWQLKGEVGANAILNDYIISYDGDISLGGAIVIVNKNTGEIEYKGWETDRFALTKAQAERMDPEANVQENSLMFSKEWNNMIYATCTNDSLYCFQIKTPEEKK